MHPCSNTSGSWKNWSYGTAEYTSSSKSRHMENRNKFILELKHLCRYQFHCIAYVKPKVNSNSDISHALVGATLSEHWRIFKQRSGKLFSTQHKHSVSYTRIVYGIRRLTGTETYLQMAYGLTVHTSIWCLLRSEEKYGFPCANLHKTRKYSAILGSKLLYRISDKSIRSVEGTDRHLSVTKPIFTQTTFASKCFAYQICADLGFYDA
jgi:hypothetical protein